MSRQSDICRALAAVLREAYGGLPGVTVEVEDSCDPTAEAARKCREKGLDFVAANDVSRADSGFGVDTNRVDLVFPDGRIEKLPLMSKDAVARRIVRRIGDLVRIADSDSTAGFNRINP